MTGSAQLRYPLVALVTAVLRWVARLAALVLGPAGRDADHAQVAIRRVRMLSLRYLLHLTAGAAVPAAVPRHTTRRPTLERRRAFYAPRDHCSRAAPRHRAELQTTA